MKVQLERTTDKLVTIFCAALLIITVWQGVLLLVQISGCDVGTNHPVLGQLVSIAGGS
jgi:hypothetical protein